MHIIHNTEYTVYSQPINENRKMDKHETHEKSKLKAKKKKKGFDNKSSL